MNLNFSSAKSLANFPKITIVTSSFNQGEYLEETILSVLDQNYPNLEYIIIDGGSTDNSVEIIKKYEKQLTYWISEKDNGLYDALNKGFSKSTGEIMAWINSDDLYHKKSLFTVAEIFSTFPKVQWIQGLPSFVNENGTLISVSNFKKWTKYNYFLKDYKWISQESCFWKRDLWEKANSKLNDTCQLAGDLDLWLRFFDYAELYSVAIIFGAFRLRSNNQMSLEQMPAYENEAEYILNERLKKINPEEKRNLKKIISYQNFFGKIPWIRSKMYKNYLNNLQYPPSIYFDRYSQSFKMNEN
ncbi:MAG TPA: glycosyltransferase family 2 protein [Bacteroidia bacterium]|nr:glycosyltransferase family 2 protein [Bacteroidia bacterium]